VKKKQKSKNIYFNNSTTDDEWPYNGTIGGGKAPVAGRPGIPDKPKKKQF
jgi:hypothetical protein